MLKWNSDELLNLANLITLSRLVVTAGVFVCLEIMENPVQPDQTLAWWAFALFLFAAITDFVDGKVARHFGQVTSLGRVIDPFADKILICGTLICLLRFPDITPDPLASWMVVVIVAREFLVTTIRGLAEAAGMSFPADRMGKLKMVMQCAAAGWLLSRVAGTHIFDWPGLIALWTTLVLTVFSGVLYTIKARSILFAST